MNAQFEQRLAALDQGDNSRLLRNIRRGIEKESLRITPQGRLAQTPHPEALGSALTHASITTDYSEALLEFITGPHTGLAQTLDAVSYTPLRAPETALDLVCRLLLDKNTNTSRQNTKT